MGGKLLFGAAAALLVTGTQAAAAMPAWKVSEVSGSVRLTEAGRSRPAIRGALLSSGATITTAAGGRAVIVRGQEFVVVSPGSRLRLPEQNNPNTIMQIIADWGSALFKIEKKSTPHFGVQTPYLAAVVKGTTFTVTVGPDDAKVQVTEGAVQVSTLDGGATDLVRPGSLAMVGKSDLYRLSIQGVGAKELHSSAAPVAGAVTTRVGARSSGGEASSPAPGDPVRIARTIGEKPVSLASLTDGLIDGASAAEHAQSTFNEHSRNARDPKPETGGAGQGNKPAEEDKPGKDDQPSKDEKPAQDQGNGTGAKNGAGDSGKPADTDKGNDSSADDKGTADGGGADKDEKPGKDDTGGAADKGDTADKSDEGDAAGGGDAGKGDGADKGGDFGKDDADKGSEAEASDDKGGGDEQGKTDKGDEDRSGKDDKADHEDKSGKHDKAVGEDKSGEDDKAGNDEGGSGKGDKGGKDEDDKSGKDDDDGKGGKGDGDDKPGKGD